MGRAFEVAVAGDRVVSALMDLDFDLLVLEDLEFEPRCDAYNLVTGEGCERSAAWKMRHRACGFLLGLCCDEHQLMFMTQGPRSLRCKGCDGRIAHLGSEAEVTPL